ncbi:hypothetical protein ANN_07406 [Periplaneta americana]|uniref:Uncharacterized protein n=1 Tax=Periplaneta americana TaxID=6978 RepID=A0ABQ8SYM3_PERAM|nr:hypothetical protein ANN_07406 [Periplaneta americana]
MRAVTDWYQQIQCSSNLRAQKWKPYISRLVHALNEDDPDRRLEFCEWFLNMCDEREDWSNENPQIFQEKTVNLPGVTVWCSLSCRGIIGPYFFEGTVTDEKYLQMLETTIPRLNDLFENENMFYFQEDRAPAHFHFNFKVCHGSLYDVMWLVDEPTEFNLPTLPQRRIAYIPETFPGKYGVHSEEYLLIRTVTPVVAGIRLRWAGHVARMGESRNAYRVLVGRPEEKDLWGGGWEDNIKMDLREVGYDDRDWINLAQDRDR